MHLTFKAKEQQWIDKHTDELRLKIERERDNSYLNNNRMDMEIEMLPLQPHDDVPAFNGFHNSFQQDFNCFKGKG